MSKFEFRHRIRNLRKISIFKCLISFWLSAARRKFENESYQYDTCFQKEIDDFSETRPNYSKNSKNLNLSSYYLHKDDAKPKSYLNDRDCRRFPPNISRTALFPLYFAFIGSEFSTFHWLELSKNWFNIQKWKFCADS